MQRDDDDDDDDDADDDDGDGDARVGASPLLLYIYVRVGASPSGRSLAFGSEPCLRGGWEVGGCGAVRTVWWCCGGGANLKCRVVNHCLARCSSPIATSGCWPPESWNNSTFRGGARLDARWLKSHFGFILGCVA